MEATIVKAGLLGTDKTALPVLEPIKEIQELISQKNTAKEIKFLEITATALLFQEAGALPVVIKKSIPPCPPETKSYPQRRISTIIERLLDQKEDVLLDYLTSQLNLKDQVLPSRFVPTFLNRAVAQKGNQSKISAMRTALLQSTGVTGRWMSSLNNAWQNLFTPPPATDIWETGTPEQRLDHLTKLRLMNPASARELINNSLAEENAVTRLSFTTCLEVGLSLADQPLLITLTEDKSKNVKEAARGLLRRLPGSFFNNLYLEFLQNVITIKEERHLLISKKQVILIDENQQASEAIYQSGIEKLSADKQVSDAIFVLGQLLANTDPADLAKRLDSTEEALIKLFLAHQQQAALLPYLKKAAFTFKNKPWAETLIKSASTQMDLPSLQIIDLLHVFSEKEQPAYYFHFIQSNTAKLISHIINSDYSLLPADLAAGLLAQLAKDPYQIDTNSYQRLALYLPATTRPILQKIIHPANKAGYDYKDIYYNKQATDILRIMDIKDQLQ